MGDRANTLFKQVDGGKIYFYTHWDGRNLPNTLQKALRRGEDRWNDEQYLARIIFCEMIQDDVLSNTGYGISTYEGDNQRSLLIVDIKKQEVQCGEHSWPFKEFIKDPIPITVY
jgi:hypothetical protein